jgi:hypothetical protein
VKSDVEKAPELEKPSLGHGINSKTENELFCQRAPAILEIEKADFFSQR